MRKFFLPLILSISCMSHGVNATPAITVYGDKDTYTINLHSRFFGDYEIYNEEEVIKRIINKETVSPQNAKLRLKNFSEAEVVNEKIGQKVDASAFLTDLKSAKDLGGGEIVLKYNKVLPKYSKSDVEKASYLRGQFTTKFAQNPSRVNNIMLATASLNGKSVDSGESFSFNKNVGKREKKRGYKTAKIIVNGKFVEGVGGGVCQVSTTLYNAVVLSDLPVLEHHGHSLLVSYVEPSFDAMVTDKSNDFRFKNDTSLPVFIFGKVTDSTVTFKIYGEKMNYKIVRESVVKSEILPKINYVYSEKLDEGEQKVLVSAKKGCYSNGYVKKIKSGKVISSSLLRSDKYLSVNGITETGNIDLQKVDKK